MKTPFNFNLDRCEVSDDGLAVMEGTYSHDGQEHHFIVKGHRSFLDGFCVSYLSQRGLLPQ